ncbi:hypothetical protein [Paenibacillus sinopodophylli]|uniref:hypothetical protein n=1 Tax=Paenibacillus sinopodophylli TaxID=1837342 RepID=UPI00110CF4BC|nr:hypothetical protein [Paenibacillus sinopodophylli]
MANRFTNLQGNQRISDTYTEINEGFDGVEGDIDAHTAANTAHGSTSAATAGRMMQRDVNGRSKVAAPAASDDIARKDTVDAAISTAAADATSKANTVQSNLITHTGNASIHTTQAEKDKLAGITVGAGGAGSATDSVIGNRTADPNTATAYGLTGTVTQIWSWITKYFKAVTGKANPFDTPDITLAATKTHVDDSVRHLTAEERTAWNNKVDKVAGKQLTTEDYTTTEKSKLAGTATGAEVNQNAFAKVNNMDATGKSDTLTLTGGVGITITNNPGTRTATITATGSAAPGAHGTTHNEDGADPIPELVTAKADIVALKTAQMEAASIPVTIKRGLNLVNTSGASPAEIIVQGRSLVNLLGKIGNFEVDTNSDGVANGFEAYLSGATASLESTNVKYGTKAQKITANSSDTSAIREIRISNLPFDANKYYLALVDVVTDRLSQANLVINNGSADLGNVITTTNKTIYRKWQQVTAATNGAFKIMNFNNVGVTGWVQFDGARIYEINATDYAKIDVDPDWTGAKLAEKYPYVDSVQHLQGGVVRTLDSQNIHYANFPMLVGNLDRTIVDTYDSAKGVVSRKWKTGVSLDGSYPWTASSSGTGFKAIGLANSGGYFGDRLRGVTNVPYCKMFDERIIRLGGTSSAGDLISISWWQHLTGNDFYLSLFNADTGWVDAVNPSVNAIKAVMNGWKATANSGTAYTSWVSILTGAAPATNTDAYCAANKAAGWTAWATLDYMIAQSFEETVIGDKGAIALKSGGNLVELLDGFIVREKIAAPYLSSGSYYSNMSAQPSTKFKNRVNEISAVYKNGVIDTRWVFGNYVSESDIALSGMMFMSISAAYYDPTAEYNVTYQVLDNYLYTSSIINTTIIYQSTLGSSVSKNVQDIADIKTHNGVQDWKLLLDEAYAANTRYDLNAHVGSRGTVHGIATTTEAGFQSAADKTKLDGIPATAGGANSATDTVIGTRSIDDTIAAATGADTPTRLWSKLAYMIKAITGKSSWFTAPATTLEATSLHIAATTGIHGAVSTVTASRLMQRDANSRSQVADPAVAQDIATKNYVDTTVPCVMGSYTGNAAATRDITLPFTPRLVSVLNNGNGFYQPSNVLLWASTTKNGHDNSNNLTLSVGANKFVVRMTGSTGNANINGELYEYIAYR